MIDDTTNDKNTVAGGGKEVILAGRYHILRQLGKGGMGAVWLAEDRQLDNRKVAIKMLPTIIVQDKRSYQQLKGEALVSLKLVHPNIVTLRAFEENNGAPFLVMDYIEGQTLSDYLAVKGKLSEKETVALLKPIAAALDYAHSEKVIHRDIKPSNIIIRKDGHPFILDFGIAREIQESMTRVSGATISGTLLYMSPEQLRGAPPAPAQDVYSFAAMAYECLKGEPPFIRGEIAYQILNVEPVTLVGGSHFVTSIMEGLSKRPENRPRSCISVFGEECRSQRRGSVEVRQSTGQIRKSSWLKVALWVAVVILTIVMSVSICWGVSKYNKKQNTTNFLAFFEAKNYEEAARLIGRIDDSNMRVQYSLGKMYLNGTGVRKDSVKGIMWVTRAAEQGDVKAQGFLGASYVSGTNGITKDTAIGTQWLRMAAEQGNTSAQALLGMLYRGGNGVNQDFAKAVYWLRKAASHDVLEAQINLGDLLYQEGPYKDIGEAIEWTRMAAKRGDGHSQMRLGMAYYNGEGVEQDFLKAVDWLSRAAENGNEIAQWALGLCYLLGNGVETNAAIATDWFLKSAKQGCAAAQYAIGGCYEEGIGVTKNINESLDWYRKAARQGNEDARNKLRERGMSW